MFHAVCIYRAARGSLYGPLRSERKQEKPGGVPGGVRQSMYVLQNFFDWIKLNNKQFYTNNLKIIYNSIF